MENYKYKMCYGELRGKSHIKGDIPCQDKALCVQKNGVSVAVLSDGCGSSKYSHIGSDITTKVIGQLFTEHFDELYAYDLNVVEEQIKYRKTIVDTIVNAQLEYVKDHLEVFESYKQENLEKYQKFEEKNNIDGFYLGAMNATLLFFVEKNDKYLIGLIGDGVVGAVVDDKLKIVLEEKKEGEVNGTYYPSNIYSFARKDEINYCHSAFQIRKTDKIKINGVILTTDGCDAFFERVGDNFHKRYAGVTKLFERIISSENFEDAQKILSEDYLPRLVEMSPSRDDCGVSILVKEDCVINERVIKEYPRPVIEPQVEEQEEIETPENGEVQEEIVYNGDIPLLTEEEAKFILSKFKEICEYEDLDYEELYDDYMTLMIAISKEGIYLYNIYEIEDVHLMFFCDIDEKLYWDEENNIKRA